MYYRHTQGKVMRPTPTPGCISSETHHLSHRVEISPAHCHGICAAAFNSSGGLYTHGGDLPWGLSYTCSLQAASVTWRARMPVEVKYILKPASYRAPVIDLSRLITALASLSPQSSPLCSCPPLLQAPPRPPLVQDPSAAPRPP